MSRKKSLWTDIEALTRLARSSRRAARASAGCGPVRLPNSEGRYPHFPDRSEFDLHACGAAARGVAGDFHDFFLVADHTLAIAVADVSGKGVPAAVVTDVTRSMIRNLCPLDDSPAATLSRVNDILCQADLGPMFVTVFFGLYDVRHGTLRYANAGHPLPLRIEPGGQVSPFGEVTGSVVGILDTTVYNDGSGRLEVDDRLVLYTDGVTDAADPAGETFGEQRLHAVLGSHAGNPVNLICDNVIRDVVAFQQGKREDDATLLALHRRT